MGKYHTVGHYRGKFKRRRVKSMKIDPYLRYGFKNTSEITGLVADPDCVYIGHSTTSGHKLLTLFLQATLRKLFKKAANWTCTNVTDPIRGYEGFGDGWRLILVVTDQQTGVATEYSYDTTTTDTIYRICGDTAVGVAPSFANLYNFWVNYLGSGTGAAAGSMQQPTRLMLYRKEVNITNFWQFCGDIYFPDEHINLYVKSELKMQNRTLSAAGSPDAEDVSNNPVIGKSYEFSTGAPRTKVEGCQLINGVVDSTGAITVRAAEFIATNVAASQIMKEPPEARIFYNVVKTGSVRLEPGDIKKDVITFKVKMQAYKFFERLDWRYYSGSIGTAKSMKSMGKSSLFAFEDLINVNLTQNINVAYEINRTEAMYLTTGKVPVAQGMFTQTSQSSVPV